MSSRPSSGSAISMASSSKSVPWECMPMPSPTWRNSSLALASSRDCCASRSSKDLTSCLAFCS
eukprot:485159-Alexandrium_andersonii.AAC.1